MFDRCCGRRLNPFPACSTLDKTMKQTLALSLAGLLAATFSQAADTYHFVKEIPVGGKAQWDYLKIDSDARLLYVSCQSLAHRSGTIGLRNGY